MDKNTPSPDRWRTPAAGTAFSACLLCITALASTYTSASTTAATTVSTELMKKINTVEVCSPLSDQHCFENSYHFFML